MTVYIQRRFCVDSFQYDLKLEQHNLSEQNFLLLLFLLLLLYYCSKSEIAI